MKLLQEIENTILPLIQNNEMSNEELVKCIEYLGGFLNLRTISDYSKQEKMDYNSVKYRILKGELKTLELFKLTFIIDNE
jgi:hypothetical protein